MKRLYFFILSGLLVLLSGCATILTGTTQKISIDSYPQGAEIIISGKSKGVTPAIVKIDKNLNAFLDGGREIQLEKEGYVPNFYEIGTEFNPVAIINMASVPCWAIDAVTGAVMRYDKHSLFELEPIPTTKTKDTIVVSPGKYDQLKKLKELLDNEVISKEEFEQEKAKLLNNASVNIVNQ